MLVNKIWEKADSLRDCLSSSKTTVSRRRYPSDEDHLAVKNLFVSDEAKLLSCKAFRVLGDKTQVFTFPRNPLIRNRQAHTMEPVLEFLTMLNIGDPFLLLALMTDKDVAMLASEPMKDMQAFNRTAISEITPHLQTIGKIDLCDPDLNW